LIVDKATDINTEALGAVWLLLFFVYSEAEFFFSLDLDFVIRLKFQGGEE
jgi:hypothetical protein